MFREETLLNVIRSVTKNGRSILLTAILAIILVYMFSIVGYLMFRDDFLMNIEKAPEHAKSSASLAAGAAATVGGKAEDGIVVDGAVLFVHQ